MPGIAPRIGSSIGPSIGIVVPGPGYREDWQVQLAHIVAQLAERGIAAHQRCWQDAPDTWGEFDLILPLFAWGYQRDFLLWQDRLDQWEALRLPLANPVSMLRWNSDKRYLRSLADAGVAIVPTYWSESLSEKDIAAARLILESTEIVVKPPVSAGADGTYLLFGDTLFPEERRARPMMIQPMMQAIVEEGEYSLFLFDGRLSHAVIKRPAAGDFRVQEQFGGSDALVTASPEARMLAEAAIAALDGEPLYARIDMVRDNSGTLRLMEVELIEPSLFLHLAPDKGEAFAKAVAARLAKIAAA